MKYPNIYILSVLLLAILQVNTLRAQDEELVNIFNYPNFSNAQDLRIVHNTQITRGTARLTPAKVGQKGGIWYTKSPIQVDKGFSTAFAFRISGSGGTQNCFGADGFALIIHNSHQDLTKGINGGGMGYDGIPNCIAIEFDTFDNNERSANHISIQTKGHEPNKSSLDASVAMNRNLGFSLEDGRVHNVKINYRNGKIEVFVDNMQNPILIAILDIANTIALDQGQAWVGISAATGAGFSKHDILRWSMQTTRPTQKITQTSSTTPEKPILEKPTVLEDRKVDYVKIIKVNSPEVLVRVWDNKTEDGDLISLNLNGEWITQNLYLKKKVKTFKVNLRQKENFLVLHALNLGRIPPNTAAISIVDGKNKQTLVLSSDLEQSQAISIVYEGGE